MTVILDFESMILNTIPDDLMIHSARNVCSVIHLHRNGNGGLFVSSCSVFCLHLAMWVRKRISVSVSVWQGSGIRPRLNRCWTLVGLPIIPWNYGFMLVFCRKAKMLPRRLSLLLSTVSMDPGTISAPLVVCKVDVFLWIDWRKEASNIWSCLGDVTWCIGSAAGQETTWQLLQECMPNAEAGRSQWTRLHSNESRERSLMVEP